MNVPFINGIFRSFSKFPFNVNLFNGVIGKCFRNDTSRWWLFHFNITWEVWRQCLKTPKPFKKTSNYLHKILFLFLDAFLNRFFKPTPLIFFLDRLFYFVNDVKINDLAVGYRNVAQSYWRHVLNSFLKMKKIFRNA